MAYGWFVVPYTRRNPGQVPPERYCSMDDFTALIARLPGEAGARGAYYSVFMKKPALGLFTGIQKVHA